MDYVGAQPCTHLIVTRPAKFDPKPSPNSDSLKYTRVEQSYCQNADQHIPHDNGIYDGVIVRSSWRRTVPEATCLTTSPAPGGVRDHRAGPNIVCQNYGRCKQTLLVGEKYIHSGAPFEYNGGGASDDRG